MQNPDCQSWAIIHILKYIPNGTQGQPPSKALLQLTKGPRKPHLWWTLSHRIPIPFLLRLKPARWGQKDQALQKRSPCALDHLLLPAAQDHLRMRGHRLPEVPAEDLWYCGESGVWDRRAEEWTSVLHGAEQWQDEEGFGGIFGGNGRRLTRSRGRIKEIPSHC